MNTKNIKATASPMPGCPAWTVAVFKAEDVPEGTEVVPAAPAAQSDAISQQQIAEIIDSYTDQGTKETSIDDAAEAILAAIAAKAAS